MGSNSKTSETGWCVELGSSSPSAPHYFSGFSQTRDGFSLNWDSEHLNAVRFARKEDAEKLHFMEEVRIAEHAWDN